jgi:acyl-CoA thioesterase
VNLRDLLTTLSPDPAGGFSAEVPDGWKQGRTVYGGLNAALAARAARLADADLGPLRELQIAFIAPPLGALRYEPTLLRRGRSVAFIGVDGFAGDDLSSRATLTYGHPRESDVVHSRLAAPVLEAPEDCPLLALEFEGAPAFLQHFELRFAAGSTPMSGGEPAFAVWVRHREAAGVDPESAALAVGDVLPPAVFASRSSFRPGSSVTWTINLTQPLPDPGGWYLLGTASDSAADGYSLQAMSCHDRDGRLVAAGRQTVAVF